MSEQRSTSMTEHTLQLWLVAYKAEHKELLEQEPEFADWLEEQYVPIAGGWNY